MIEVYNVYLFLASHAVHVSYDMLFGPLRFGFMQVVYQSYLFVNHLYIANINLTYSFCSKWLQLSLALDYDSLDFTEPKFDIASDSLGDITSITSDILGDSSEPKYIVTSDILDDITSSILDDITSNILDDITSNILDDITSDSLDDSSDDCLEPKYIVTSDSLGNVMSITRITTGDSSDDIASFDDHLDDSEDELDYIMYDLITWTFS